MPDVPAEPPPEGAAPRGTPGPSASEKPSDRGRSPGWREVLLIAGVILAAVLALEIASAVMPPVREAFRGFPVTIAVLIAGTIGLLLLATFRRPRR